VSVVGVQRETSILAQRYNEVTEELRSNETRFNNLSVDFDRQQAALRCADQDSANKAEALKLIENKLLVN